MELDEIADEPIYLLTSSFGDSSPTPHMLYWFVIEDGRNNNSNIIPIPNPNLIPDFYDYELKTGEVEAVELSENYSDIFRSLPPFPNLSSNYIHSTNLVVINSRIYMLGGHDLLFHKKRRDPILPKHANVRFFDLHNPSSLQIGPSFPSPQSRFDVATSNNGSILVIGSDSSDKRKCLLWLESLTSTWKVLPNPPDKLLVFSETFKLLALTDTHIFCTFQSKSRPSNYGLRFNFVNKEWEVFDKMSFDGFWSKGVMLYDKYLVLWGCNIPSPQFFVRGLLCVYDLGECR